MTNYAVQTIREIQEIALKSKIDANEAIQDLGLSAQQGRIIKYIYTHQEQSVSQKDLANYFNVSTASIGGSLKVLEKHNYIKRTRKHENARQYDIIVLPLGESIIDDFDKKIKENNEKYKSFLSEEEFKTLHELLVKIKTQF
ncbi:TPA: MarR family transcriptional regulator [Staphylococcus argenteus]|nr:MarR family transcriptional regulator [Staphylococcus argenteus]